MASDEHHDATPSHQDDGDNTEQSHPSVEDEQGEDGAGAQDEHDAASDSNKPPLPKREEAEQQPKRKTAAPGTVPSPVRKSRNRPNWIDEDEPSKDQQMTVPNRQRRQSRQTNEMYQPRQQSMQQQDDKRDNGKNPLKLRLDLNLEVDIELKARIHGDITLALLEGL